MLRIEIIGNLGSGPEQRYTAEGKSQISIRVAVNSRRRGQDGENVERTDWFRARVMGAKAEYVERFRKGQRVLVMGRLQIEEWTTREGEPRTSFDIWADDVVNLSPREDGASSGEASGNGYSDRTASTGSGTQRSSARSRATAPAQEEELDDLPF